MGKAHEQLLSEIGQNPENFSIAVLAKTRATNSRVEQKLSWVTKKINVEIPSRTDQI